MKYKESMPLTSISPVKEHFLMGGGGGNPLFGFPNKLILIDKDLNLLCDINVKEVVVSSKVYDGAYAVVEYPGSFEVFVVEGREIKGPFVLPAGVRSPVVVKEVLYYIRGEKIFKSKISKLKGADLPYPEIEKTKKISNTSDNETAAEEIRAPEASATSPEDINTNGAGQKASDPPKQEDTDAPEKKEAHTLIEGWEEPVTIEGSVNIRSLYTDGENLLYKINRNSVGFLCMDNGHESMLDGSIAESTISKSFGYIVQWKKDLSIITMTHEGKSWTVIEPMCITIHSMNNGMFYVGTGTGHVIGYKDGVEQWRKKVFTSPVSSIGSDGSRYVYCTCINGRVSKVSVDSTMRQIVKVSIFMLGVSACFGMIKYYAKERAKSILYGAMAYVTGKS